MLLSKKSYEDDESKDHLALGLDSCQDKLVVTMAVYNRAQMNWRASRSTRRWSHIFSKKIYNMNKLSPNMKFERCLFLLQGAPKIISKEILFTLNTTVVEL